MAEFIEKTDTLNEGREKINAAIQDAEDAKTTAGQAVNISNQAKQIAQAAEDKADSTQTQLDTIVIEGDSSVEAAQARVDVNNHAYDTLKQRLDTEYTKVTSQLAQTENRLAEIEITPMMFGAVGDGLTDDRQALIDTFRYAMDNNYTVNLLDGKTYLINSQNPSQAPENRNLFEIDGPIVIKGKSKIKIGAIGDYESVFRLRLGSSNSRFYDFEIDENTRENHVTDYTIAHQEVGKRRITFYGWNSSEISNIRIEGVKFTDCIGVWQVQIRANNVHVVDCEVNYAENSNNQIPKYDRTCMWARGNDWVVKGNKFNGSPAAKTCIEVIGNNNLVEGNYVINFNSMFYITNALNSKNINIINNYFECRSGMEFWFQAEGGTLENINIINNTLKVTEDDPPVMTTAYNTQGNVLIKNIIFELNTVELNSTEEPFIWFHNANTDSGSPILYEHLLIKNNTFKGTCKHLIHFGTQPTKRMVMENVVIEDNRFFIDYIKDNYLINVVDANGGFEDVLVTKNKFKIKECGTDSDVFRIFNGNSPRHEKLGVFMLKDNEYDIPDGFMFSITNFNGQRFCSFEGVVPYNLLDESIYIQGTTRYIPQKGYIEDIDGQRIIFKNGEVEQRYFKADEHPTFGPFSRGDYVENNNPKLNISDGVRTVVKGWIRVTNTESGAHELGVDWVEDKISFTT